MSLNIINEVNEYIQLNINYFHEKRLEYLNTIKLKDILKRKNPYLFRAKYFDTVEKIVTALLEASLSSSE